MKIKSLSAILAFLSLCSTAVASFAPIDREDILGHLTQPCPYYVMIGEKLAHEELELFERILDALIFNDEQLELHEYRVDALIEIASGIENSSEVLSNFEYQMKVYSSLRKSIRTYLKKMVRSDCYERLELLLEFETLKSHIEQELTKIIKLTSGVIEGQKIQGIDKSQMRFVPEEEVMHVERRKPGKYSNRGRGDLRRPRTATM